MSGYSVGMTVVVVHAERVANLSSVRAGNVYVNQIAVASVARMGVADSVEVVKKGTGVPIPDVCVHCNAKANNVATMGAGVNVGSVTSGWSVLIPPASVSVTATAWGAVTMGVVVLAECVV